MLASGGLDSSVLLAELARKGRHVFPIYVRAGLRWERVELASLRKFIAALKRDNIEPVAVLDFPTVDIMRDHWSVSGKVPGYRAAHRVQLHPRSQPEPADESRDVLRAQSHR